jgi:hypothetical protein
VQHYNQVVGQLEKFGSILNQTLTESGSTKVAFLIDSIITPNCTIPNEGIPDKDPYQVIVFKQTFCHLKT